METIRHLGHCQICAGEFKLDRGRLVPHGYKRPGWGSIVGGCYGVGHPPYEQSCETVKTYKRMVEKQLTHTEGALADLRAGKVARIVEDDWRGRTREFLLGVTPSYDWDRVVEKTGREYERRIVDLKREIARLARRITDWKLEPIRETSEEKMTAEKRVLQVGRVAERAKKHAEKEAKQAVTRSKREALEASREAIRRDLAKKIHAFALAGDVKGAQKLAAQQKKHANWLWLHDLGADDDLVRLEMADRIAEASPGDRIRVRYRTWMWS